ncbi:hypothetical protein JHN45_29575, partial [Streptomyces sp. MBT53]|nr:hypothetical protein [Streptomyces sp. MBT53]
TRPLHTYGSHLPTCPWCTRAAVTGHDVFNPPVRQPVPVPPPAEPAVGLGPLKVVGAVLLALVLLIVVTQLL